MDFNEITQGMLEEYEKQYFDVLDVPSIQGVHRMVSGNINSAEKAGWFTESLNGLSPIERQELSKDIDLAYKGFLLIDPSG